MYVLQFVFGIWSAVLMFLQDDHVMFGIILTPLVVPVPALSFISLVWYRDQDKVNGYLSEAHPRDRRLRRFKRLLGVGAVLSHITGLTVLYRLVYKG